MVARNEGVRTSKGSSRSSAETNHHTTGHIVIDRLVPDLYDFKSHGFVIHWVDCCTVRGMYSRRHYNWPASWAHLGWPTFEEQRSGTKRHGGHTMQAPSRADAPVWWRRWHLQWPWPQRSKKSSGGSFLWKDLRTGFDLKVFYEEKEMWRSFNPNTIVTPEYDWLRGQFFKKHSKVS